MKKPNLFLFTLSSLMIASVWMSCQKSNAPAAQRDASPSQMVNTPEGPVPSSEVFVQDNTTRVEVSGGRMLEKDLITGNLVRDLGPASAEDGQAPNLYVPSGVKSTSSVVPAVTGTSGPGYTITANVPSGDTIEIFSTTWVVPPTPPRDSTIFWWNGLSGGALQPVLQWENGAWTLANWYYLSGYHHGTFVSVSPGDTVTGVVYLLSNTDTSYTYHEYFAGYPTADVTFTRPTLATQPIECQEAYTNTYLALPADTIRMYNINCYLKGGGYPPAFSWNIGGTAITTPSGLNTVIVSTSSSTGEMDFYDR